MSLFNPNISNPFDEEEGKGAQDTLVALTDARFVSPDDIPLDSDAEVQVSVEYLTDRTPRDISFMVMAKCDGEIERGAPVQGSISNGVASATVQIVTHMGFYFNPDGTERNRIEYSVVASCNDDGTELASDTIVLPKRALTIDMVEVVDKVFNSNSAVPCLDSEGSLVASIATCFKHMDEWPDKEVLVYGHTDTTGEDDYNFGLSEYRSKAIKALLNDDTSLWNEVAEAHSSVIDYQTILKSLSSRYGWSTDPGVVDGDAGSNTNRALESFQNRFNDEFSGTLTVDGCIGPASWGAIMTTVRSFAATDSAVNMTRVRPMFVQPFEGVYPCGESFPIENTGVDAFDSESNRRVEIQFSDRPNPPVLPTPVVGQEESLVVYDSDVCDLRFV
ncbi:MAG: OmpA family protein [Fibrobacterales bacterium]